MYQHSHAYQYHHWHPQLMKCTHKSIHEGHQSWLTHGLYIMCIYIYICEMAAYPFPLHAIQNQAQLQGVIQTLRTCAGELQESLRVCLQPNSCTTATAKDIHHCEEQLPERTKPLIDCERSSRIWEPEYNK